MHVQIESFACIINTSIKPPSSEAAFECFQFLEIFLVIAHDRDLLILHNALKVRVFNGQRGLDSIQIVPNHKIPKS